MSFLSAYDALEPAPQVGFLVKAVLERPGTLFAELRADRPILVSPGPVVVTKFADCVEVLRRHQDFSVRAYAPRMQAITGPFFLGEDDTALYERDASAMRLVARRDDLPRIRAFLRERAAALLADAAGEVELVGALTRRLPAELMGAYLGVPGPDVATLQLWARELFREIFTNLADDPAVTRRALELAGDMRRYVDELVRERRSTPDGGDTVLDRLLSLQLAGGPCLDDLTVRHNLIGLVAGAIDTTSKAVVHVVDVLLDRPDELAGARAAALSDDVDLLAEYCFEALRLRPQNSMLVRICERAATIGAGTARETEIAAGKMVFVATSSAMLDADVLPRPEEFALGRPDHTALHFGVGLHTCFGRHINRVQIVEQTRAILRLPDLRRTPGEAGRVRYDGPFPDAFHVSVGPGGQPCPSAA